MCHPPTLRRLTGCFGSGAARTKQYTRGGFKDRKSLSPPSRGASSEIPELAALPSESPEGPICSQLLSAQPASSRLLSLARLSYVL